jgi:polysaccharide deacetylase 2 family uncharacterized protein YibQ
MSGRRLVTLAALFMLAIGGAGGAVLWFKGRPASPPPPGTVAEITVKLPPPEPAAPVPATPAPGPAATPPAPPEPAAPPSGAPRTVDTPPPPPLPQAPMSVPQRPVPKPPGPVAAAPAVPAPTTPAPAVPAVPAPPPVAETKIAEMKLALFDPALAERSKDGTLPMVGRDGRQPWQVYARPFDLTDKRPRVAIVVTNMGLSAAATDHAINALPGAVTLAFAPFAEGLKDGLARARGKGHEVLLNAPMEPESYPRSDPGPKALLTSLSEAENLENLTWILTRGEAYVGIANLTGGRFAQSPDHLKPVLAMLRQRGLLYVDRWAGVETPSGKIAKEMELPFTGVQMVVDQEPTKNGIDGRLAELERIARRDGRAVGLALPYPLSLERIALWINELDQRGAILAPVSAVVSAAK